MKLFSRKERQPQPINIEPEVPLPLTSMSTHTIAISNKLIEMMKDGGVVKQCDKKTFANLLFLCQIWSSKLFGQGFLDVQFLNSQNMIVPDFFNELPTYPLNGKEVVSTMSAVKNKYEPYLLHDFEQGILLGVTKTYGNMDADDLSNSIIRACKMTAGLFRGNHVVSDYIPSIHI